MHEKFRTVVLLDDDTVVGDLAEGDVGVGDYQGSD